MDLYKAIRELVEERKRIDKIIVSLEAMLEKGGTASLGDVVRRIVPAKRRGRKSMSPEERLQVSERMARYWAGKRSEKTKDDEPGPDASATTTS